MPDETQDTMPDDSTDLLEVAGEPAAAPAMVPQRPPEVPEKFWDPVAGTVRTDSLVKSYAELERKLSLLTQGEAGLNESTRARLLDMLGRPPSADQYRIEPPNELVAPDPELNARLHNAGFTQAQAQLVYELAAERLLPVVGEIAGELAAQRQADRLERHFGGADAWRAVAGQIRTWAQSKLEPEIYATLAGSHDGVLALYQMMRADEPKLLDGTDGSDALSAEALDEMVRDPRYWRQRDPNFIGRVTEGFKKLYGG
jgi:hypothetical protein